MEAKAQAKYVRCTPRKARRVVDVVRGKRAVEAVNVLRFAPQAAAVPVRKVIESAIANARFKAERDGERFDENELFITEVYADEGPTLKRFRPRAQTGERPSGQVEVARVGDDIGDRVDGGGGAGGAGGFGGGAGHGPSLDD